MKKIISTALFVSVLLFTAQNVDAQSETREVGPFDGVHIAGPYEVTLTSGKEGTISLSGDDEDLENIESYIKKGKLIIKKKNKSWLSDWTSGKVTIRIPIEEISSVILSGSGKIKSQKTITANRFKTVISGSGDIDLEVEATSVEGTLTGSGDLRLSGKTELVEFQITGSGDITAQDLKAQTGQAQITGSGDIEMHATETLNGSITGSGDLLCYGSPERQVTKVTGSGDITIRD